MTYLEKSIGHLKRINFKSTGWLVVLVMVLAVGFRLWRLNVDLPYIYRSDEDFNVVIAQNMIRNRDLNPYWFGYPSLLYYLNAFVFLLHYLIGNLIGQFGSTADIPSPVMAAMGSGKISLPSIMLASRLLIASFGIGSVLLVYLSGRKLTGSVAIGTLAAVILAVSPTHITSSQKILPDGLVVFFIVMVFYGAVRIYVNGNLGDYILTGIALGLAASSKYNSALIVVAPLIAHFFRYGRASLKRRELYICLGLGAVAFFATTPYSIIDYRLFIEGITFSARRYATGHAGYEGNTLQWYTSHLLTTHGPLLLLALAGLLWGVYRRSRSILLIAAFPVIYFIFINRFAVRNPQTILPIIPFLSLLAATTLVGSFQWLSRRLRSPQRNILIGGLVAVGLALVIIPFGRSIVNALNLGAFEKREPARIWIEDNLPGGVKIAVEPYSPFVDPDRYTVIRLDFSAIIHPLEWYRDKDVNYIVMSTGAYARYFADPDRYSDEIASYEQLFSGFELVRLFEYEDYTARIYAVKKQIRPEPE